MIWQVAGGVVIGGVILAFLLLTRPGQIILTGLIWTLIAGIGCALLFVFLAWGAQAIGQPFGDRELLLIGGAFALIALWFGLSMAWHVWKE